ncbi:hypothetical protein BCU64_002315 [Vibrio lentus]|nr:hypothetical protein [Vibrio lentus]
MKINRILGAINTVDGDFLLRYFDPNANINSRIYIIGQVKENVPGADLG